MSEDGFGLRGAREASCLAGGLCSMACLGRGRRGLGGPGPHTVTIKWEAASLSGLPVTLGDY